MANELSARGMAKSILALVKNAQRTDARMTALERLVREIPKDPPKAKAPPKAKTSKK